LTTWFAKKHDSTTTPKGGQAHNKSRWGTQKEEAIQTNEAIFACGDAAGIWRERERERADDGQTKVSFASREPKKCASGNQGIF
jgi:hypothetical protein